MLSKRKKEIIGMIHLGGPDTIAKALDEIKIYDEEGLDACIIENYHGSVEDVIEVLEALKEIKKDLTIKIGINILPNDYKMAFELATKYGAEFIQMDYISGSYLPNIEIDVEDFEQTWVLHPEVNVYGGVWPKYYTPKPESDLKMDLEDANFFSDAIVVTGEGTGKETSLEKIVMFRKLLDSLGGRKFSGKLKPLIVGAGLTPLNVAEQLEFAQGGIVGTAFKPNGRTQQMVDRDLVKTFMVEVNKINDNL